MFPIFTGAMAVGAPFLPAGALLFPLLVLGVYGFILSMNWGNRLGGGVLRSVRKTLEVRRAEGPGYRDATGRVLVVDGVAFDAARVREVTVRSFLSGKGGPIFTTWLVLDDRAFNVDQSRERTPMNTLAHALCESLIAGVTLVFSLIFRYLSRRDDTRRARAIFGI
jgi:hypothetical protein